MNKILTIRNLCSILRANLPLTSILITGFLAILSLSSCSEDSEPESNIFNVQYSVDSIGQVTTIEHIIGKSKLDESQIQVKDNSVLTIERKGDGFHYIIPQHVGYTQILVNANDKSYKIIIRVLSEGCESWEIRDVVSRIICSYDVKNSILDDLNKRDLFSGIQKGDKLHFGTDPRNVEIWYEKYYGEENENNPKFLIFSYDQSMPNYLFTERRNAQRSQRMSFVLTRKEYNKNDNSYDKEGFFRYNPTLIYQELYGKDKVQQIVIDYKVKNIYNP